MWVDSLHTISHLFGRGLDDRLGMVRAPLALRLEHGLLEVRRRAIELAVAAGDALEHGVRLPATQVHGGLHEDALLTLWMEGVGHVIT